MVQCEGAVPQLAEVLILPAKQLLGLAHLPLESGNALGRLTEQPQDLSPQRMNEDENGIKPTAHKVCSATAHE